MVKMVNDAMCVFYHNKIKEIKEGDLGQMVGKVGETEEVPKFRSH